MQRSHRITRRGGAASRSPLFGRRRLHRPSSVVTPRGRGRTPSASSRGRRRRRLAAHRHGRSAREESPRAHRLGQDRELAGGASADRARQGRRRVRDVTEGGITRFNALFHSQVTDEPSARSAARGSSDLVHRPAVRRRCSFTRAESTRAGAAERPSGTYPTWTSSSTAARTSRGRVTARLLTTCTLDIEEAFAAADGRSAATGRPASDPASRSTAPAGEHSDGHADRSSRSRRRNKVRGTYDEDHATYFARRSTARRTTIRPRASSSARNVVVMWAHVDRRQAQTRWARHVRHRPERQGASPCSGTGSATTARGRPSRDDAARVRRRGRRRHQARRRAHVVPGDRARREDRRRR